MEFLQNVDLGGLLLISIGLIFLCVMGLLIFFGLQLLGTGLSVFLGVFEFFGSILSGGPVIWCGCVVLMGICALLVGGALIISSCSANPNAMNFCMIAP